uniref:hypothetical protein n=1 Tax=Okeania sp. SIO2F4 TaxID=2607790 RepID=UPI0025F33E48|nr:hypothetical protein [Okeania sp. SIO2F4]
MLYVDRWFPSSKTCSRCGTESRVSVVIRARNQIANTAISFVIAPQRTARTRLECSIKFSYGGQ